MKLWQWMALGTMFLGVGSGCATGISNTKKEEERLSPYVRECIEDFFDYNFIEIDEKPNEKCADNTIVICRLSKDYLISKNENNKKELELILYDRKSNKKFAVTAPKSEGISVILYPLIPEETEPDITNRYSCLASAYYYYCTGEFENAKNKLGLIRYDENVSHTVLDLLGDIATAEDSFKVADRYYNDAIKDIGEKQKSGILEKQDYLKNRIFYTLDKARMNYKEKNNKKALKNLQKALSLTTNLEKNKEDITAIILYSLGDFYHKTGDYQRALDNLNKASDLLKGDNLMQQNAIIRIYEELSKIYSEMRDYDNATKFIRMTEDLKNATIPYRTRARFDFNF